MDGAKGSGAGYQEYEFQKWFATIQKHEGKEAGFDSDCMLFGAEAYTTVRWIGNELGYANEETWSKSKVNYDNNTIDSKKVGAYTVGYEDGNQWTVPESDAVLLPAGSGEQRRIRQRVWRILRECISILLDITRRCF